MFKTTLLAAVIAVVTSQAHAAAVWFTEDSYKANAKGIVKTEMYINNSSTSGVIVKLITPKGKSIAKKVKSSVKSTDAVPVAGETKIKIPLFFKVPKGQFKVEICGQETLKVGSANSGTVINLVSCGSTVLNNK